MGGKLHKEDRIRIRHRTRLSKSIRCKTNYYVKHRKIACGKKMMAREKK